MGWNVEREVVPTWRGFLSLRDPAALPGRPGHPTTTLAGVMLHYQPVEKLPSPCLFRSMESHLKKLAPVLAVLGCFAGFRPLILFGVGDRESLPRDTMMIPHATTSTDLPRRAGLSH
jgi:hypothetical protein